MKKSEYGGALVPSCGEDAPVDLEMRIGGRGPHIRLRGSAGYMRSLHPWMTMWIFIGAVLAVLLLFALVAARNANGNYQHTFLLPCYFLLW